ncbi:MAG TPA: STAS domain-containing protein [Rugosimonospora sp.]|nr:STAS domain-containing protein [Rugosimonospora sp.]
MSTLSLTVQPQPDGAVLISPHGEIDADNAHEIREAVSGLLATSQPAGIKVDMVHVSFIDSVGIGALVACYHAAAASGIRLLVTNPTAYVHRVLYVSGLLGLFGSPARLPDQQRPVAKHTDRVR